MRTILRCVALFALTTAALAHADENQPCNSETVAIVARWANIQGELVSREKPGGVIAAAACKVMPNAPATTITAVAFDTSHRYPDVRDSSDVQQVIALVQNGKVVAAARSIVEEDAITLFGTYRIDTAPYILSPTVRAFGVVFNSSASALNIADATATTELTLWIREGDHLRAVFGTNLDGWVGTGKASTGPGSGYEYSESAHMTIAVEKASSHGFADLSVTAHVTQFRQANEERVTTGKRTVRTVLKYDGKSYGIDMFRCFWYPPTSPCTKPDTNINRAIWRGAAGVEASQSPGGAGRPGRAVRFRLGDMSVDPMACLPVAD